MKTLHDGVEEYVNMRRALGFKLDRPGRLLFDFVSFMQEESASHITTELALRSQKSESRLTTISILPCFMTGNLIRVVFSG